MTTFFSSHRLLTLTAVCASAVVIAASAIPAQAAAQSSPALNASHSASHPVVAEVLDPEWEGVAEGDDAAGSEVEEGLDPAGAESDPSEEDGEAQAGDEGEREEGPGEEIGYPRGDYPALPLDKGVLRLSGENRYATAAQVAGRVTNASGHAETVFVASGASYADGLTIGALAAYTGSPVLLVQPNAVPAATAARVKALHPDRIVIAGGTGAVSDAALRTLSKSAPEARVERIGGADRYETAALISSHFPTGSPAFLATGTAFPDALSASAAASKLAGPVLLTPGFRSSSTAAAALAALQPASLHVVGGKWSHLDLSSMQSAAGTSSVEQLAGPDRYATSAAVARKFWETGSPTTVYATGRAFADAMVGVAAAKAFDAPILLTNGGCRTSEVAQAGSRQSRVVVLGGSGAVSDYAYNANCITPSPLRAVPTYKNGAYSFNIAWSGQQTGYWCGPASAYMVLGRLGLTRSVEGVPLSQAALASNAYIETERFGRTRWEGNHLGKGIQRWTGHDLYSQHPSPNPAALRSRVKDAFLKTGRPVMLHQTIKPDRPVINNQRNRDTTHVLVVNSYDPHTDTLTILDSAAGVVWPDSARSFKIKVADMAKYLVELGLYY